MARMEAMIYSMTPEERENPDIHESFQKASGLLEAQEWTSVEVNQYGQAVR